MMASIWASGRQAVGARRKDHDLAGKVLLEISLKCFAARIELAALFGIDVTVGEHAVKGIDGAQRHGVADHQQVVKMHRGSRRCPCRCHRPPAVPGVLHFWLPCLGFRRPRRSARMSGTRPRPPSATTSTTPQTAHTGIWARAPAGGRGGAIAEFGDSAAEGALPKRCFDKAIGALGYGDHHKYLQDVLPPGRIADVGDRVHKQQQWIVPRNRYCRALARPTRAARRTARGQPFPGAARRPR